MKMQALCRYDIPPEVVALWEEQESEALLPLQELVVKRHGLFDCGNLLVQAPTSSGKTFVGEMAAVQAALRRRKVVYLVPLKALAEEKYRDFSEKYTRYGIEVIVSTRDRREFDQHLENGDFAVAIVVYEKLAQLLVRRPERLEEIALVVADELELLSDPERGGMVELLLTRLLQSKTRLIGLSAVLGEAEQLAAWLDAALVSYERRPVELRYGVLHEGVFHYRTFNDYGQGEERLIDGPSDSPWETVMENVRAFVEQDEACLIFVKAKHESRRGAELLADRVSHPAAEDVIEALGRLEPTRSRDGLMRTLGSGVAFHNADLSPEERRLVEQGFRAGAIRVLVSTSTLAIGMNLPARNVFMAPEKWRYDERFGMPWKTPILCSEYENMGGRAGRYGVGHPFGRAILIGSTQFDYETLWRRYVEGEREPIEPQLARERLENPILRLVSSGLCRTEPALLEFLERTLTGQWVWRASLTLEECAFRIRAAVNRAVEAGVITCHPDGGLEATPLGCAVAAKGIQIATATELRHWIGESEARHWSPLDLLFATAMTPDGRMPQVMLTGREYNHADYPGQLKRAAQDEDICADVPLNRIRNCNLMPFFEEVRAIKVALFLSEWIEHAALNDIEERYHTMAGQLLSAAEQVAWLVDAVAALATALGCAERFVAQIETLARRAQAGLREEALPLAHAGGRDLGRSAILALVAHGLHTPEVLAEAPLERLTPWVSQAMAQRLHAWARGALAAERVSQPERDGIALVLDDRRPGSVVLDGATVVLQDKQYRLLHALARRPGECVSYKTIYAAVWGDSIVDGNQMHFQKRRLLAAVTKQLPQRTELVTTVPKRGFVLNLSPEEVLVRQGDMAGAAYDKTGSDRSDGLVQSVRCPNLAPLRTKTRSSSA